MAHKTILWTLVVPILAHAANAAHGRKSPVKVFILAGQSNMVGQGASYQLDVEAKRGNERVLMFEKERWQPKLPPFARRPHPATYRSSVGA